MRQTAFGRATTRTALTSVVLTVAAVVIATLALGSSPSAQLVSGALRHGGTATAGRDGGGTEADGVLPAGVTVFDDRYPGVVQLDPDLLRALRAAASDAAHDGVTVRVNSGWRSAELQDRIFREAVSTYGSEAEAARWAATAATSAHVTGDAVDIGSSDARAWLAHRGSGYGLCRIYRNEPWHYELRPEAIGRRCPRSYPDPTHDPRMHSR